MTLRGVDGRRAEQQRTYNYFYSPQERKEIFEFSSKLADFIHEKNIRNLVIVDRSSRPAYIGINEYWKFRFPSEPPPNIYFINPKGFNVSYWRGITEQGIIDEFSSVYKKLSADKDKSVLFFDTCIHSGRTLKPVIDIFKKAGFTNILVSSVKSSDPGSEVKSDFSVTEEFPEGGCYPFGRDTAIVKTVSHVFSDRTTDTVDKKDSSEIREEIHRLMKEEIGKERLKK
ncbi:MAG: hypothetical protein V1716_01960 [Candidatus Uhrbacteria bacterium]